MSKERKMRNVRQPDSIWETLNNITIEYSTDGIKRIYLQDHVSYAILHYAETLKELGIKNGTNIRKALNL